MKAVIQLPSTIYHLPFDIHHLPFAAYDLPFKSFAVLALTIAGSMFCCWFLSRYLPWFTAQKDLIRL